MAQVIELTQIQSKILEVRGIKVMLDKDLAELYQVETKYLNKAVKRNIERFPDTYMFQLSLEEFKNLKFQFGTSRWGGTRKNPYAFTEHGVLMTASILKSSIAIQINQKIIEAFIMLRKQVSIGANHSVLSEKIKHIESRIDTVELSQRIDAKLESDKIVKLSSDVRQLSKILDDFQSSHIVIKRPDEGMQEG